MGNETIIVLGGAKSAASHDLKHLRRLGFVIGVNDAAMHVHVDAAVTMDRTWFENRWERAKALDVPIHARAEAVVNVDARWPHLHIFRNDRESNLMVKGTGVLNGINSGFCALNLAYQMKPKKVMVLGIDALKAGYWYPPYEWQTTEKPRGITSDWAYARWAEGLKSIHQQFAEAGIEWI